MNSISHNLDRHIDDVETPRMRLVHQFRDRLGQFGIVSDASDDEKRQLRGNYDEALRGLLVSLNKSPWNPLSVRTKIVSMDGSYKNGEMRLGVCPPEINFPTIMYLHLGITIGDGHSEISEENRMHGLGMTLTSSEKHFLPSDIDIKLRRRFLWKSWNPVTPKWGMEIKVYNALKENYEHHGVFINLFPDSNELRS